MNKQTAQPLVLRPAEGRSIDLGNFAMSLKADKATTAGAFSLLEAAEPPDFGPPMHIHHDAAEAFYVLEGEYRIFIGGGTNGAVRPVRSSSFPPALATASALVALPVGNSTCTRLLQWSAISTSSARRSRAGRWQRIASTRSLGTMAWR